MDPDPIYSSINNANAPIDSNNMSDNEQQYHDLFLDREDKDKPKVVQVSPSSSGFKKRKKTENESIAVMHGLNDTVLHMFPFQGVETIVNETLNRKRNDPRGFVSSEGEPLPEKYCESCRCHIDKCHDTRFGLYCGLQVAEQVQKQGADQLFGDKIDDLLTEAYNEILRVVTVLDIERLDTYGKYELPKSMKKRSWINVMRHFYYQKFTVAMERRLTDGTHGIEGNGTYSFFNALSKDKP